MHRTTKIISSVLFLFCYVTAVKPLYADTRDAEYNSVDAKLNETYSRIRKLIRKEDLPALQNAQRAWIKMRDMDCKWASADKRDCMIERTWNRESELRHSYFNTREGKYINLE